MADLHGPLRTEHFTLEIDGTELEGFTEIQIPNHIPQRAEYRTGDGFNHQRALWSQGEYEDLVVTRPIDDKTDLYDWREKVEEGDVEGARVDVAVLLGDSNGESILRWNFTNAWPREYIPPTLSAESTDPAVETLIICHEGMERVEQ
mgnify:FL=1